MFKTLVYMISASILIISISITIAERRSGHTYGKVKAKPVCTDYTCMPNTTEYQAIYNYTQCGCLPTWSSYVRFQHDENGYPAIVLNSTQKNITILSKLDLYILPPLGNLSGSWDVFQEDRKPPLLIFYFFIPERHDPNED